MDGKEWLKIKGAKLWLTNETKIDKAIITSAMIGSVDAGTISVGTLDASKIRVVNLDASSISTGTLNAITIKGATITGSKITSTGTDYNMTLDNGAIRWNRKSDGKKYSKYIVRSEIKMKVSCILQLKTAEPSI